MGCDFLAPVRRVKGYLLGRVYRVGADAERGGLYHPGTDWF